MLCGKFDNIIQYHQAQPKGPGFIRMPPQQRSKDRGSDTVERDGKTTETNDSEEMTPARGQKRRSSRVSATEEHPSSKKLRSSQKSGGEGPEEMKSPPLRSSRRLRSNKQQASSISSPSSSPTSPPPPPSPSPPPPSRRSLRSRGPVSDTPPLRSTRRTRGSSSLEHARPAKSPSPVEKEKELYREDEDEEGEQEEEEMDHEGLDTVSQVAATKGSSMSMKELERFSETAHEQGIDRPYRQGSPTTGQSPHEPEERSIPSQEEINYTIVHGTPSGTNMLNDISSPVSGRANAVWQHHEQQQVHSVDSAPTPGSNTPTFSPSGNVPTPPASRGIGDSGGRRMGGQAESNLAQQLGHDHQPAKDVGWGATAAAANLPPQFHGGYPPMYNPSLHALPYPAHHGQPVPGANYPYAMPYPWGHAPHIGGGGVAHPKPQELQHQQVHPSAEVLQHPRAIDHSLLQHHAPHTLTQAWSSQHPTPSTISRPNSEIVTSFPASSVADSSVSAPSGLVKPPGVDKLPSTTHHPGLSTPPTLHQIPLAQAHHVHAHHPGFHRPPHALTAEHMPPGAVHHPHAPTFPYGFESNPHALSHQMQMWQQTQMQPPSIRPLPGMHPSPIPSHIPPPGMWYSPMAHLVPGHRGRDPAIIDPSKLGKKTASKASSKDDGLAANRNANNSNELSQPWYAAQYQSQAFPSRPQHLAGSLSVERLSVGTNSAQSKSVNPVHLAHGPMWTPVAVAGEGEADARAKLGGAVHLVLNSVPRSAGRVAEGLTTSALLESARRDQEMAEIDMGAFSN